MTARSSYEASVKSAGQTAITTLIAAETTKQETIAASGTNVGYTHQSGNNANLLAAVKAAAQARWLATYNAEQAKQAALAVARDTLRATGDLAPF